MSRSTVLLCGVLALIGFSTAACASESPDAGRRGDSVARLVVTTDSTGGGSIGSCGFKFTQLGNFKDGQAALVGCFLQAEKVGNLGGLAPLIYVDDDPVVLTRTADLRWSADVRSGTPKVAVKRNPFDSTYGTALFKFANGSSLRVPMQVGNPTSTTAWRFILGSGLHPLIGPSTQPSSSLNN